MKDIKFVHRDVHINFGYKVCRDVKVLKYVKTGEAKKSQIKCHLETVQTTFSEINNYYKEILLKIIFFSSLKMHHFRGKISN